MTYYVGDTIRFTATFADDNGTAADPGTVTFTWQAPVDLTTRSFDDGDAEVTHEATGVYHCDLVTDQVGLWEAVAVGTTPIPKSIPARWSVSPTL